MLASLKTTASRFVGAITGAGAYRGNWSTPHPDLLSGLAPMSFSLRASKGALEPVRLFVRLGAHEQQVPLRVADDRANAQIGIHTHLLANGPNDFAARFETMAGDVLWSAAATLTVVNDSPLAARVRESLVRRGTPLIVDNVIDSADYDFADASLAPWFDRPDAKEHIAALRAAGTIDDREASALEQFVDDGYLVLEGLIDDALIAAVNADIDRAIATKHEGYVYGTSQRIEKLHHLHPDVRKLWLDPRYLRMLDLIFDATARPCQTLTYVFGSQQTPHQDTAFLTPFPAGYMCGTWIALEDIRPGSGELEIYPGSHRAPRPRMHELGYSRDDKKVHRNTLTAAGSAALERFWAEHLPRYAPRKVVYRPARGTVLIWHENLIHGGGVRQDESLSRRSMVVHSFADGALAFFDHSGYVGYNVPKAFRTSKDGLRVSAVAPPY